MRRISEIIKAITEIINTNDGVLQTTITSKLHINGVKAKIILTILSKNNIIKRKNHLWYITTFGKTILKNKPVVLESTKKLNIKNE